MGHLDEGWAIIAAAFIAIIGIVLTGREGRKALRKQHTYSVLDKMNDWKELDDCYNKARSLMNAGKVPSRCNGSHTEDCDALDFLLNHYEFLSAAMISGDLDEPLVKSVEEGRLTRLFLKLFGYIEENRTTLSARGTWENMEYMCYRWTLIERDLDFRIAVRLGVRPNTTYFHAARDLVWAKIKERAAREP